MNKERYEEMMLRFAKELHDVGVTDNIKKVVEDRYSQTPNLIAVGHDEDVRKFTYRHNGYEIEAIQNVKLTVRKCK